MSEHSGSYETDYRSSPEPIQYLYYGDSGRDTTTTSFPTSSARDEVFSPTQIPNMPQPQTTQILDKGDKEAEQPSLAASTSHDIDLVRFHEVAQGLLSNGSLTVNYPAVRDFLTRAEHDPSLPLPTSAQIFVLAALAVFYHPTKRAHWMFWNRQKREETAAIVHKLLNMQPETIKSPIAWMGVPENLGIVGNLQFGWKVHLSKFPWYAPYAETKPTPSKTRMNLRKRKQPQEQGTTDAIQEDASAAAATPPPKKRPRTRRVVAATDKKLPEHDHTKDPKETDEPEEQSKSSDRRSPSRRSFDLPVPQEAVEPAKSSEGDVPKKRMSQRQMERRAKGLSSLPVTPNKRPRSISVSESSTAVSVRGGARSSIPPSFSDSSMTTAVDVGEKDQEKEELEIEDDGGKTKGKGKDVTSSCPPMTTRSSSLRAKVGEDKVRVGGKAGSAGKVRNAVAPYTTDKEEQNANVRGKKSGARSRKRAR